MAQGILTTKVEAIEEWIKNHIKRHHNAFPSYEDHLPTPKPIVAPEAPHVDAMKVEKVPTALEIQA